MEIYILINNQPQGPYTPELVRKYLKSGELQPGDLAAYAGSADWKPLATLLQSSEAQLPGRGARFAGASAAAQKPRPKGSLTLAIVGGIALLLAAAGSFAWWKFSGNSGPEVKIVTPPEPGLPNSMAELNAWYAEPPEGQNAATFILKGFDSMQVANADRNSRDLPLLGKGLWPAPGGPFPSRTKTAIAALAQRNETAFEAFRQGAKFDQARYPMDLSQGFLTLLPHLSKVKPAVQLLGLTASLAAENNQPRPATDSLLTALACGQSLKNEPLLISQLVRVSCLAIATTNLEHVVNSVALPSAELNRLAAAFAKAESEESTGTPFTRFYATERAVLLSLFDMPPDKLMETLAKRSGPSGDTNMQNGESTKVKELTRNLKSQRTFMEETYNHCIAMRKQPLPERLKADKYFTSRATEAETNEFKLCLLLTPNVSDAAKKEAAGLAELRLAQTAIALEQFRAANDNRYPTALEELAPKFLPSVPQDPFNGEALRYRRSGNGYELSSTGTAPGKPITFKMINAPKPASE